MDWTDVMMELNAAGREDLAIWVSEQQTGAAGEREDCAKHCDAKAKALGERADQCDDIEDSIELKARAWQMTVLAAELRKRSNVN